MPSRFNKIKAINNYGAEVKDIETDTEWSNDGLTITANGTITLYNMNGMKVATENDILQAPAAGIYIMDINGKRTKINIR